MRDVGVKYMVAAVRKARFGKGGKVECRCREVYEFIQHHLQLQRERK